MKKITFVGLGIVIIVVFASFTSVVSAHSTESFSEKDFQFSIINIIKARRILDKKVVLLLHNKENQLNTWFPGYFFWLLMTPILELMKFAVENFGWEPGWVAEAFLFFLFFLVFAQEALLIMLGYTEWPL